MEAEEHQPPASPGEGPPVQVKDCIQEILRWTLTCSIKGEVELGLSKDYCFRLLQDDPANPFPSAAENLSQGVPSYPLYKHLAASLYQSLSSAALVSMPVRFADSEEDESLKPEEDERTALIMENGSELVNMLKAVDFELHVQEPFFSQLHDGHKTVEGRCASGNYNRVEDGDCILFNKCLLLKVQNETFYNLQYIHRYVSFHEMLEAESLQNVLPGVATFEEGTQIYRKFYSEEKERSNGVLAICVAKPSASLHSCMTNILLVLSYAGIQRMLNMGYTTGSIPEALPPPPSVLVSSFLTPHNPHVSALGLEVFSFSLDPVSIGCFGAPHGGNGSGGRASTVEVQGSMLTDGARALAKHVNRSSAKYWGNFCGSDSDKNRLALEIISRFIVHCCWLNMHVVPPHGTVFEVRVAEGYGARWSEDGHKFIGFLEPYMVDGHQRGWKH